MRGTIAMAILVLMAVTSVMAGGVQGPSVTTMMANKAVTDGMKKAWQDSFSTSPPQMRGGWIYANPNNVNADMVVVMAGKGGYNLDGRGGYNLDGRSGYNKEEVNLAGRSGYNGPIPPGYKKKVVNLDGRGGYNKGSLNLDGRGGYNLDGRSGYNRGGYNLDGRGGYNKEVVDGRGGYNKGRYNLNGRSGYNKEDMNLDGRGGYNRHGMSLDNPDMPTVNNKYVLVGDFRTHPFPSGQRDRADSDDVKRAFNRGVPGMVVSCSGLYYYGPASRASMDGPSTYPNISPAASYNGQKEVKLSDNVLDSNPSLCSST